MNEIQRLKNFTNEYNWKEGNNSFNDQVVYEFNNGYGASVVSGQHTYGGNEGLLELAVLKQGRLCYSTEITNDVIGHLEAEEAMKILERIKSLPNFNKSE